MVEFLETFETHLNLRENRASDGKVSLDEFVEYYKNISSSIDNDDYFTLMMNNSWNLRGNASPYIGNASLSYLRGFVRCLINSVLRLVEFSAASSFPQTIIG